MKIDELRDMSGIVTEEDVRRTLDFVRQWQSQGGRCAGQRASNLRYAADVRAKRLIAAEQVVHAARQVRRCLKPLYNWRLRSAPEMEKLLDQDLRGAQHCLDAALKRYDENFGDDTAI